MKLSNLFSRLGADPAEMLSHCSEKARLESSILGATLILPMAIWAAGGYSTAYMMGGSPLACALTAAFLMTLILILDRGMMSHASKKKRGKLGLIARFGLAFVGSLVFAHPAVFLVAQGVIDRELAAEQQLAIEARKAEIAPQLDKAHQRVALSLQQLQATATTAQQAVTAKQTDLAQARDEVMKWTRDADLEANGKRSGIEGEGKRFDRITKYKLESQQLEATVRAELAIVNSALEQAQSRLTAALKSAESDPEALRLEHDIAQAVTQLRSAGQGDPFTRFEALHRVIARQWQAGSYSLGLAYAVICLLLLGLEIIPICLKLGSTGGELSLATEQILFKAQENANSFRTIYPTLSAKLIKNQVEAEIVREQMKLDNELAVDRIRMPAERVRRILVEQAHVFELAEDVLRRGNKKREDHRKFSETLAQQLVEAFQVAVRSEMNFSSPGAS